MDLYHEEKLFSSIRFLVLISYESNLTVRTSFPILAGPSTLFNTFTFYLSTVPVQKLLVTPRTTLTRTFPRRMALSGLVTRLTAMARNSWELGKPLTFDEAANLNARQAAHCMIYSRSDRLLLRGKYPEKVS
jgi:hypothetical protein